MGDSNATIIRKAYQDFAQGNIPAVFAAFDTGIAWHVPGYSPLSGNYRGRDQIAGFFGHTIELSGGDSALMCNRPTRWRRAGNRVFPIWS